MKLGRNTRHEFYRTSPSEKLKHTCWHNQGACHKLSGKLEFDGLSPARSAWGSGGIFPGFRGSRPGLLNVPPYRLKFLLVALVKR